MNPLVPVFQFLRLLPLRARYLISELVTFVVTFIPSRERKIAELQLKYFLKVSSPTLLIRAVYRSMGYTLAESFNILGLLHSKNAVTVEDPEFVREMQKDTGSKLLLTAHLGNWELLAAWCARNVAPGLTVIGRALPNKLLQEALVSLRQKYGVKILLKGDKGTVAQIISGLKDGMNLGALIDQDSSVESTMIPFFGTAAKTPSLLVKSAKKYSASIYLLFMIRLNKGRFLLRGIKLDCSKSTEDVLFQYNSLLEQTVREFPEQWAWIHKRWRSKDLVKPMSSRDYIQYLSEHLVQNSR